MQLLHLELKAFVELGGWSEMEKTHMAAAMISGYGCCDYHKYRGRVGAALFPKVPRVISHKENIAWMIWAVRSHCSNL